MTPSKCGVRCIETSYGKDPKITTCDRIKPCKLHSQQARAWFEKEGITTLDKNFLNIKQNRKLEAYLNPNGPNRETKRDISTLRRKYI